MKSLPSQWEYTQGAAICKPGGGLSPDKGICGTLILDFCLQNWEKHVCCWSHLICVTLLQQPELTKTVRHLPTFLVVLIIIQPGKC